MAPGLVPDAQPQKQVRRGPILCDKRRPPQQPLRLFTRRLLMTLNCPTWLEKEE